MRIVVVGTALALTVLSAAPALAYAHPARGTCERFDGEFVLASLPNGGVVGLCYLPNGYVIEEGTLLQMQHDTRPIYGGGHHRHRRY